MEESTERYGACGVPHTHPNGILCSLGWCDAWGPYSRQLDAGQTLEEARKAERKRKEAK